MSDMGLKELDPLTLQYLIKAGPNHFKNEPEDSITITPIVEDNDTQTVQPRFQPKKRYFVEGRIIHKRKLSRRLFFLDLVFVRRKRQPSENEGAENKGDDTSEQEIKGQWEDIDPLDGYSGSHEPNPDRIQTTLVRRVEVITRFPTHSLKDLDDLWCKVHLGAVVKVVGDIELSENKQTSEIDTHSEKWSALLHCMDFETLELWTGKEPFQPHPGAAEIHSGRGHKDQNDGVSGEKNKKRKSTDMLGSMDDVQRGDDIQPHCKFWLNSGKCSKNPCPFWHETDLVKLKAERRRWVEERVQAKRQISHHASDPHQKTTKNQHRERALYFAHWLVQTFSREFLNSGAGVLDIAGGRGDLSWELQTRQGIKSTIVEPRAGKGMKKWQRRWLAEFIAKNQGSAKESIAPEESTAGGDEDEEEDKDQGPDDQEPAGLADFIPKVKIYDLQATEPSRIEAMLDDQFLEAQQELVRDASILIGLHPDQATEPIVQAALKAGKPFAVIPCCVFSRENPHRRLPATADTAGNESGGEAINGAEETATRPVSSYDDFVTWLATLHPGIETTWLNFEGMNRILFWRGPSSLADT